jgi:apolipoprotein N-acyltransferase
MKVSFPAYCVLVVFVFALAAVGCGRRKSAAQSVSPQESAINVQSVFRNAAQDVKQQAGEVVTAVQSQNTVAAYAQLENLSGRQNLTSEQQQAIFEMRMALVHQLQAESAKGNAAAEELLNKYRATK